jgi:hypothetical protein
VNAPRQINPSLDLCIHFLECIVRYVMLIPQSGSAHGGEYFIAVRYADYILCPRPTG